jgi:hypothetical protein
MVAKRNATFSTKIDNTLSHNQGLSGTLPCKISTKDTIMLQFPRSAWERNTP